MVIFVLCNDRYYDQERGRKVDGITYSKILGSKLGIHTKNFKWLFFFHIMIDITSRRREGI